MAWACMVLFMLIIFVHFWRGHTQLCHCWDSDLDFLLTNKPLHTPASLVTSPTHKAFFEKASLRIFRNFVFLLIRWDFLGVSIVRIIQWFSCLLSKSSCCTTDMKRVSCLDASGGRGSLQFGPFYSPD